MKLKSLILGSVAAAGLATGAQAADLGVLTSLDVCDALGLSGLTISSDTNCLQITGSVSYKFVWGDYKNEDGVGQGIVGLLGTKVFRIAEDGYVFVPAGTAGPGGTPTVSDFDANNDWESNMEAWIKFVATADSDFGPAKAVIKIKQLKQVVTTNEGWSAGVPTYVGGVAGDDDTTGVVFDEAYVSIGDATVIMAGKKGSIYNKGDDEPFNWLGLFNSEEVDAGVGFYGHKGLKTGGHVIQVVSDLGNGVSVGAGLEALDNTASATGAGTAVGVISYAGEGLSAHVSLLAGGILDSVVDDYAIHAGFTGTFEQFRIRGAFAAHNSPVTPLNLVADSSWMALASAEATFDMFKLAISGEAQSVNTNGTTVNSAGFGGSASAMVSDGITINIGARWFDADTSVSNNEGYQVAASLVAAVTETIKLTGEVGVYGNNLAVNPVSTYYGSAEVAWAPGGGFTSSVKGEVYSNGAYKATFKAAKTFE